MNYKTQQKRKYNKKSVLSAAVISLIALFTISGCDISSESRSPEAAEPVKLDIQVVKSQTGEDAFSFSLEEFIKSFNSFYAAEKGEEYLPEVDKWNMYATGPTIHNSNETMCFAYSQEPAVRAIPQIIIYADSYATEVYQISISYDDHSYSPETYDLYKELTAYTLKTMFPDKKEKEIKEYTDSILAALDESFTTDKTSKDTMPQLIYNEGGIGIYPYYVVGELMEVRLIPAAQ